ncbi:ribosomal protein S18-alanine N-acetyltransferase [Kallotenue papyrolyticum]|uniref:ribosomal protein S18-alanine N-acetyltransferase n=1 Tax=Kallotenue papyrolyticum TaxID=1325125 RepID=UPI0004785CCA|nr:ribosomal protein S18-alanine N-acetyltransferase [Kallotenue papyrolyticum]
MYFFIEAMRESDIPRVQEIERQSFSTPWSAATYLRELRSPEYARYIVARASRTRVPLDTYPQAARRTWLNTLLPFRHATTAPASPYPVVGYGGIWLSVDEAHITTIASAPEVRGRGVGELLLNGLIDLALECGASFMTLEVRVSNQVAQNLYLKYGFEARGVRRRYYTDNNEDALIMWTGDLRSAEYQARLRQLRMALAERLKRQEQAEAEPQPAPPAPDAPSSPSTTQA